MEVNLDSIMYNLIMLKCQRMDFIYTYNKKDYLVKAYMVGKIIRIDIEERKAKE